MRKVKVLGAGSIGNHLAQACRRMGWDVTVVDPDAEALRRMKEEIYPKRYGDWDCEIKLFHPDNAPKGGYDVILIGTPPDIRMRVAIEALKEHPQVLQLEKPLFVPLVSDKGEEAKVAKEALESFLKELEKSTTQVVVGYEYPLGDNSSKIANFITNPDFGEVRGLEMSVREEWSGIFSAHHWLSGPHETYLGFWQKGGGASGEHSHAIHYWQHFASLLGIGQINQVSAAMQIVETEKVAYDSMCCMNVSTDKGFIGRIIQDVVTDPPLLSMRIQREKAFAEWYRYGVPGVGNVEKVRLGIKDGSNWNITEEETVMKRPDDFFHEIKHIKDLLDGEVTIEKSPIGLQTGLQTLSVVTAAHKSRFNGGCFIKV